MCFRLLTTETGVTYNPVKWKVGRGKGQEAKGKRPNVLSVALEVCFRLLTTETGVTYNPVKTYKTY